MEMRLLTGFRSEHAGEENWEIRALREDSPICESREWERVWQREIWWRGLFVMNFGGFLILKRPKLF